MPGRAPGSGPEIRRLRPVADIPPAAENGPLAALAGGRPEFVHAEAVAADQLQVEAALAGGAQDQTRIRAIAADVEHVHLGLSQSLKEIRIIVRIGSVKVVNRFPFALRPQLLARLDPETLAVGAAVVHDRDLMAAPMLDKEIARQLALSIVPAVQPEDVPPTLLGGRGWVEDGVIIRMSAIS